MKGAVFAGGRRGGWIEKGGANSLRAIG